MKKYFGALIAVAVLGLGTLVASPANAATLEYVTTTQSFILQDCVNAMNDPAFDCTETETTTVLKEGLVVSVQEALAVQGLSVIDSEALVQAAAAGTVRRKTYSQFKTGDIYTVTHNGSFYYDGTRAWVRVSYRGVRGSHNCIVNGAFHAEITQTACSDTGTTANRNLLYRWNVTLFSGTLVRTQYSVQMQLSVRANGTTS